MPVRTNPFQELVAIIHEQRAHGATVEESGMLPDATGEPREVDVLVRARVADHDFIIGVEVIAQRRRASVEWVDRMTGKHAHLPTNLLVLVSRSGFTPLAEQHASLAGAKVVTPEALSEADPKGWIVNRLKSLWSQAFGLTPERFDVDLMTPEGTRVSGQITQDTNIHLDTAGHPYIGMVWPLIQGFVGRHLDTMAERFGLSAIKEDGERTFILDLDPPVAVTSDGQRFGWAVMKESTGVLHRIERLQIRGTAHISVGQFKLEHGRLGDVMFAHGRGQLGGHPVMLVVTEDGSGSGAVTLRPDDEPQVT